MAKIIAVQTNFPEHRTAQEEIKNLLSEIWPDKKKLVEKFSVSSSVKYRDLSIPLSDYQHLGDIGKRNLVWQEIALKLQEKNLKQLIEKTSIDLKSITQIVSTTVTGLSIPTLEAKLMNKFSFAENVKRVPLFGIGCLGGVAGLNRLNDYLEHRPKEAGLLLATELCTLTFQFGDQSLANLVGTSLFGDGAAVLLMVGDEHPLAKNAQFEVIKGESFFYPDTERVMGWDVVSSGFQIVLSGDVPEIVKTKVSKNVDDFLRNNDTNLDQIDFMISHPGGPKVLDALVEVTNKTSEYFKYSYDSLKAHGNMSSVSVLHVMQETIEKENIAKNKMGLMLAMGPAFCSELALIKKL
jgi:alkylresorcinol/alkylpyrone synthase